MEFLAALLVAFVIFGVLNLVLNSVVQLIFPTLKSDDDGRKLVYILIQWFLVIVLVAAGSFYFSNR